MALNNFICNHLMPLPIKGLTEIERKDDVRVYVLFGLSENTLQQER